MNQDELNTQKFVKQVLELMKLTCNLQPLELIFSVVQSKSRFKHELAQTIQEVSRGISKIDGFMKQANFCFEIFRNQDLSQKLEHNIRFYTVERCLLPFLESSGHHFLAEFFIQKYEILVKYLSPSAGPASSQEKIL